jgi:hypothetical protein
MQTISSALKTSAATLTYYNAILNIIALQTQIWNYTPNHTSVPKHKPWTSTAWVQTPTSQPNPNSQSQNTNQHHPNVNTPPNSKFQTYVFMLWVFQWRRIYVVRSKEFLKKKQTCILQKNNSFRLFMRSQPNPNSQSLLTYPNQCKQPMRWFHNPLNPNSI